MSKSLEEAKNELRARLQKGPTICPCCSQGVELVHLDFTKEMIQVLQEFYDKFGMDPGSAKETFHHHIKNKLFRDLEEWCLIRQIDDILYTYEVTKLGEEFLKDEVDVPEWLIIYDGSIHKSPKEFKTMSEILNNKK